MRFGNSMILRLRYSATLKLDIFIENATGEDGGTKNLTLKNLNFSMRLREVTKISRV